ncbi:MAG TPA: transposase [Polyangia bacterium]|nr:transposase [Polyangia bacterium]
MAAHVGNLRHQRSFRVIEEAIDQGAHRFGVRMVRFSVEDGHIHLLVEAPDNLSLASSLKGLSVRLAKALNGMMRRSGRVISDRYDVRLLRTPTEVRQAIALMRGAANRAPATAR